MKLFNKDFKSGYDELIAHYPIYYREVYEMNEILKSYGKLADDLENGIERIFFNCFIDTADKNVLASYERIIGIVPEDSKSLEERRSLIKSHLAGAGKISASLIKKMIGIYTGAQSECIFEDGILKIGIDRGKKNFINFSDIYLLLSSKLPAHILFGLSLRYKKSIVIEHSKRISEFNLPNCGMNFCGQELMREGGKMFWPETFLNYLRNYAVDKIFKFQYLAEDRWRDAEIINKKAVDKNILLTVIISSEESFAIKGVRIVDSDETVLGQLSENIKKNSSVLTFEWTFPLYEI